MTVEDAKAPGGSDQQARARKENPYQEDGEFALFTVETGRNGLDQPWSRKDAQGNQ